MGMFSQNSIEEAVKELDYEQRDILMKYIYRYLICSVIILSKEIACRLFDCSLPPVKGLSIKLKI